MTPLQNARLNWEPNLPEILKNIHALTPSVGAPVDARTHVQELRQLFPNTYGQGKVSFAEGTTKTVPLRVGVVLSGGQASGGHNVITGLFDALKKLHPDSQLIGFMDGPAGIVDNVTKELTGGVVEPYRNLGGFDMIGSGRTKIETPEQFAAALQTVTDLKLDGLIVIGGDDSNTNAALLADYFHQNGSQIRVCGVPKTIDGDLRSDEIETSFGFDSACKTYSEIIGNLLRDSVSAKKYTFFIKLMGRSASHIALECALQTHANVTLISEEIASKGWTLQEVTDKITDAIIARSNAGRNYGAVLIPEGVIEFIPECQVLIRELNANLAPGQVHAAELEKLATTPEKIKYILGTLSLASSDCFRSLPQEIQQQLLLDRDPHGNVQVSKIESERLFIATVTAELRRRKFKGDFSAQPLFCGYEGRACLPSNFDANYCYALGHVAALLVHHGLTGYLAGVQHLTRPPQEWTIAGIPLTSMMTVEERHGKPKPVIEKALVDLQGKPFQTFAENRERWMLEDDYRYPGPIQFFGDSSITDQTTLTLKYERSVEKTLV